ncbi:WD40 repeat domain-containing serine/threonine protein kinase [Actinomadura violacea]|uniref:non-specific serine/threonine protein kinase n=1 Tax=Actinomadura violacea TaxID=2819934 RepID=A0ABS3S852_9ACTN|nr:serine/threonine-protein kinase [Actinomadura violacea]MBO2465181.1 serine/threonine protein kinase [Actinomadura violacea]
MRTGMELAGRYRLDAPLGRGGMGEVWRGTDLRLRRPVAVKLLPLTAAANATAVARFRREAEIAAALNHPGITTVFDIDEHRDAGERLLFLVMELMVGRDLASVLAGRPEGLPVAQAAGWAAQILDALAVAHGQGVVHRDIKPANLFLLDGGGRVKICDFGIARLADATKLTATGGAAGTPLYMAPEQIEGGTVDHRTDLYAFGCVLYEMLTGGTWIDTGSGMGAILYQHLGRIPAPPGSVRPGIAPGLDALVLDLLAKRPGDRPENAAAVALRLQTACATAPAPALPPPAAAPAAQAGLLVREHGVRTVPPQTTADAAAKRNPSPEPSPLSRRNLLIGGLIATVAMAGVPLAQALTDDGPDGAEPAARRSAAPRRINAAPVATLQCSGNVYVTAFTQDGRALATCTGRTIQLWNLDTRTVASTYRGPKPGSVETMAFRPHSNVIVHQNADTVQLWDTATNTTTATIRTGNFWKVAASPDGKTIATADNAPGDSRKGDGQARLWDVATGRLIAVLGGHTGVNGVTDLAFSPDGKSLATSSDEVRIWDVATAGTASAFGGGRGSLAFSPDGKVLAVEGEANTVLLRTLESGRVTRLTGHTGPVTAVAYAPDGSLVATASEDETARIWDTATGTSVATLTGHHDFVWSVAFGPDGKTLATGGWDRTARLWAIG